MEQNITRKPTLTKDEIDIIGEVCNISMGSAATALSNILGEKVVISTPEVEIVTRETIKSIINTPSIGAKISYTSGIIGSDLLVIRKHDVIKIVNRMMGEESGEEEFGEMQLSAIGEVMNQMMGSSATSLAKFLNKVIDISPPEVFELTEENKEVSLGFIDNQMENLIFVKFNFEVENIFSSALFTIMTQEFGNELVKVMMKNYGQEIEPEIVTAPVKAVEPPAPQYQAPPVQPIQQPVYNEAAAAQAQVRVENNVVRTQVYPVKPQSFDKQPELAQTEISNFGLIQDVPLEISIEVGRTKKVIKEIIDLSTGSIIELDKQAGDPVDVIVNGQLIAHGEVVVIDESFGVRITEIVSKKNSNR
jgi:flagellar motor switch protein FliN/FliY